MERHEQGTGKRRRIILAIAILAVMIPGIAAYAVTKNRTAPATDAASLDNRSAAVRTASQQAETQASAGNLDQAAATLNAAITNGSGPVRDEKVSLYLQLATVYAQQGNVQKAVSAETAAIALDPNNWRLYKNAGSLYEQLNDPASARSAYERADALLKKTADYQVYHSELQGLIDRAGQTR